MRYGYLTPHQYKTTQAHIDTFATVCWTGTPLDIASPHEADKWIGEYLLEQIHDRFRGRMAVITAGLAPTGEDGYSELANRLGDLYGYPLAYGFILTADTALSQEVVKLNGTNGDAAWYCVNWKLWFEERVQPERLADLWAYLSHAAGGYLRSPERRMHGLAEPIAQDMARQGHQLLKQCTDWIVGVVQSTWAPQTQQLDT